jgi:acetyltransferase-like isoleucine patch superfamily enzyme
MAPTKITKRCSLCKRDKPLDEYSKGSDSTYCRHCRKTYDALRYRKKRATGYISPHALIGQAPEHRAFTDSPEPALWPQIDKSARVEAFVTIDCGMSRATTIGARTWLLKHAHVGHDVVIGEDSLITVGAIIGGSAEIGNRVKVGLGAVILPFRKIGDDAVIGAGAVVTQNVPAGTTVVGNPARVLIDAERDARPFSER